MSAIPRSIIEVIEQRGPVPFEDFMDLCLYDPTHGYFATGPLRSQRDGDFLTSPEVSTWFGQIIARYVESEWERLGRPEGFTVIEAAAGSGSLLRPLLDTLRERSVSAHAVAIEVSPAARRALASTVAAATVVEDFETVLARPRLGVVIANELLDNLPVAVAVRMAEGWAERHVAASGGRLEYVAVPARPEVVAWCEAFAGDVATGAVVEVQLAAAEWVRRATAALSAGSLLLFDYGGTGTELRRRREAGGTLRTYRGHHLGPDPLQAPGETDVTVDVDFTAVATAAAKGGHRVEVTRQADFLRRWGLDEVVADLRRREREAAAQGDTMQRLMLRSEATNAETLLHPRGLGDFRVLQVVIGEPGGAPTSSH